MSEKYTLIIFNALPKTPLDFFERGPKKKECPGALLFLKIHLNLNYRKRFEEIVTTPEPSKYGPKRTDTEAVFVVGVPMELG